jgi:hypothetical protein
MSTSDRPDSESLQCLVERFGRAHWISGAAVTPEPFALKFTVLGQTRIRQVIAFLDGANSVNFEGDSFQPKTPCGKEIVDGLEQVLLELMPPRLSQKERQTLFALALLIKKQPQ